MKTTDKKSISRLVEICRRKNLSRVVFSPGSRNAPLVIAFTADKHFHCETIPDERVAAFVALGKSIASRVPTILCCTSGSAVLNYAPAIVEALYQGVPLLVLTADRPSEWIDQGIGQSMRQKDVYSNYIKGSYQLVEEAVIDQDLISNDVTVNEAINLSFAGLPGPVHINIPFYEPLYGQEEQNEFLPPISIISEALIPGFSFGENLKSIWQSSQRKIIIAGLLNPNDKLKTLLSNLSEKEDIIVLTEVTSNQFLEGSIQCIDRALARMHESASYNADLLISIGGPLVSKKIKEFFYKNKPNQHWYVNKGDLQDSYRAKPIHLPVSPEIFLEKVSSFRSQNDNKFSKAWTSLQSETKALAESYLSSCPFSDLKVFETVLRDLPLECHLHLANSTPIRYAQLFDQRPDLQYYSNRGVSGIDGSSSTSMGFASITAGLNVLISGDMSFLYDSNAFWQSQLPNNLKVVLINNGGGGIFRIIPGPESTNSLENVFEAHHQHNAQHICAMYKVDYSTADSISDLKLRLKDLWASNKCSLIEVTTPRKLNDKILKDFFIAMQEDK